MRLSFAALILIIGFEPSVAGEWRRYVDPLFGYSVSVPNDGFDIEADPSRNGLTIYERDGRGQIDDYAIGNEDAVALAALKLALSKAER